MNKVVYVSSYFKPVGKAVKVKVPTGEKKKGLLGGEKDVTRTEEKWEQTGWSNCEIDGERLADDIAKAVKLLNSEGYEVVSISEALSGAYNYLYATTGGQTNAGYGYGYGYSYTEGVTIVAKKMA
ncbi:hypothetical protein ELY33_12120 [Vreelandella andesensis]|uniref:Uncharacterized protein n=1 Tax=Vreelandella andesensis TaxID=447567 RepID=A0A3S0W6N2_9GAMM|nr:hypothetical protein [Halomonas andesensis]RUR29683.1 hypothetical protein ELY33_12120 [Halomonas andesensis]